MAPPYGSPGSIGIQNYAFCGTSMSGLISGQPIIVLIGNGTTPTISDTFSTPYTWTQIASNSGALSGTTQQAYIGTGGAGTSGTVSSTTGGTTAIWIALHNAVTGPLFQGLNALDGAYSVFNPGGNAFALAPQTPTKPREMYVAISGEQYDLGNQQVAPLLTRLGSGANYGAYFYFENFTNGGTTVNSPPQNVLFSPSFPKVDGGGAGSIGFLVKSGSTTNIVMLP